ncbi:kinesin [Apiospora saccharicola]|uniref:Kinesin n=1 Tax=Apiospora saccharicola TaxID=335842 RepID=A0ABR1WP41_9PEZI
MADWAAIGMKMARLVANTNAPLLDVLRENSEMLKEINDDFQSRLLDRNAKKDSAIDVTCFFEELTFGNFVNLTYKTVFWTYTSNAERIDQVYKDMSDSLEIPGRDTPESNVFKLVCDWFSDPRNGSWLLVLDNVDDKDTFYKERSFATNKTARLIDYLPRSEKGRILITTRDSRIGTDLSDRQPCLTIPRLTLDQARLMLRKKLPGRQIDPTEPVDELLVELERLPLAIAQAAAYMVDNSTSIVEYREELLQNDIELSEKMEHEVHDPRRDSEQSGSVFRTWSLSFSKISRTEPRAADMLSLMAVLDRQSIPRDLLKKPSDTNNKVTVALGTLQAYSLIQENIGGKDKTFSMHRLVSLSTQRWLEQTPNSSRLRRWHSEAITVLSATVPSGEYENWRRWAELLPHTQVALGYLLDSSDETDALGCALILTNTAWYELRMGRYESAHRKGRQALAIRERLLGDTHEDTLFTKSLLALTFGYQNQIADAIKLNEEVLVARTTTLGEDHVDTLKSLNNLAWLYSKQEKWSEVQSMRLRVLEARRRTLGPDHRQTIMALSNLADAQMHTGELEKALPHSRAAYQSAVDCGDLGQDHPDTLETLDVLGGVLRKSDLWPEAEEKGRKALRYHTATESEKHPATLLCKASLVLVLRNTGKTQEADTMYGEVLRDYLERDPSVAKGDVTGLENLTERLTVMKD